MLVIPNKKNLCQKTETCINGIQQFYYTLSQLYFCGWLGQAIVHTDSPQKRSFCENAPRTGAIGKRRLGKLLKMELYKNDVITIIMLFH